MKINFALKKKISNLILYDVNSVSNAITIFCSRQLSEGHARENNVYETFTRS